MKRILFVDDEQQILDGLKRLLRSNRGIWEMDVVDSGDKALAAMDSRPFDVIVTDMKMPGMDGASLLEAVQQRNPRTVRIVLSGHADLEASMRSASVSHQFMAKPCDPGSLTSVVNRACSLDTLLNDPKLQEALGGVTDLPVLPRVYKALTAALADEDVDIQMIAKIVEQDLGIATKILQLVNSSYFGVRQEITDLRQATSHLGINTIRDLVLSFEIFRQFDDADKNSGFSIESEQRHSMLAARIARRLLKDKKMAEMAFLAAMLHDVGKLVCMTRLKVPFLAALRAGAGVDRPCHEVETEIMGVSHAEIGAYLLGLWGMPYPVVEAVANHHCPARVEDRTTLGILGATHVASTLAHEVDGTRPGAIKLEYEYLRSLGLTASLPEWRLIAAEEAACEQALT